jgi:hypothetical protein
MPQLSWEIALKRDDILCLSRDLVYMIISLIKTYYVSL